MDSLVDQGFDVNVMPISIYKRLTDERPAETDIRLSVAVIKFDKGTITLRFGKSKISFHKTPETLCKIEKRTKNDIEPIAPTMTVNRIVLEWEERMKLHQEKEMKFDQ
ncbi:hypothetical protein Tco_0810292 [Tanacetum coccineum]